MIKRTIEISGHGNHLHVSEGSLVIRKGQTVLGRVPLEDLGLLVLDAPTTTYTHSVLTQILRAGGTILACGKDHHPCGLFLPQNNTLQTQRLATQVAASLPLRKRLWKQIVQSRPSPPPRRRSAHPANHGQAVRAHARFLGENAQTNRAAAAPARAFLRRNCGNCSANRGLPGRQCNRP